MTRWWAEAVAGVDKVRAAAGRVHAAGGAGSPRAHLLPPHARQASSSGPTAPTPATRPQWLCFDACPTYVCMPFAAERLARLTPRAKVVIMLRDPADGLFSSETMLRNFGCPLQWSLAEPDQGEADPRCAAGPCLAGCCF
jgi:hypothetical protein